MCSVQRLLAFATRLAGVLAFAVPVAVQAQVFEADYQLMRPLGAQDRGVDFSQLRIAPIIEAGADFTGAGLSLQAGSWFGQVGMGRGSVVQQPGFARNASEVVNFGAGYRFTNGQTLSLQLSQGRGPFQRLGLAVNYGWPQYFVRFSYDQGANPMPQDNLRFSAGVRF